MQRFAWLLTAAVVLSACTSSPSPTLEATNTQAPVISRFGASPTSGAAPLLVRFFWSISDANRDLMSCELDVSYDGQNFSADYSVGLPRTRTSNCTSSSRINHPFAVGTHTVALRVCDGNLCTIRTQVITVTPNPNNRPPLLSNFAANPNPVQLNTATTFSWTTSDPDNNPLTCTFDPDAGASGNETTVPCNQPHNHTYTLTGNYTARITVSDGGLVLVSQNVSVVVPVVFTQIFGGYNHSCALTGDGKAYCWGNNDYGQLGNGTNTSANTPQAVSGGLLFSDIGVGEFHTCALSLAGSVHCWGRNNFGQLGTGNTTNAATPQAIDTTDLPLGTAFKQVTSGTFHTCALSTTGAGYCWGWNSPGQLGNGSNTDANKPQAVGGNLSLSQIRGGPRHTCALTTGGGSYCWGQNGFGQLGNGNTTDFNTPQVVDTTALPSGVSFSQIRPGVEHTCALTNTGQAYCWGRNVFGQLGTGNTTDFNSPQAVNTTALPSGVSFSQISPGGAHTCAHTPTGQAYCWGRNNFGQLGNGDNTFSNQSNPQAISGSLLIKQISTAAEYTCALTTLNGATCWGRNSVGQLGNGNNTNANTPQAVVMP